MRKNTLCGMIALAMLLFPLHAVLAASNSLIDQVTTPLHPILQQLHAKTYNATAQGKTYTDKKNGFSLTLPTGWKKITTPANSIFAAQPTNNIDAELLLTMTKYKTQKQANAANTSITKNPKNFGKLLLKGFQAEFPTGNCILKTALKKNLGGKVGTRANVNCVLGTTSYTLSTFAFVHKLTYYAFVDLAPTSQFSGLLPKFDAIIASMKFTK
ncbi:MAG: hypothetical protein WCT08_04920 [Patescibacteria group bacterium]|jgi:hypothetical protein